MARVKGKTQVGAYIDEKLWNDFKDKAYQKTKSFKGISKCLEEAIKEWFKKS